MENTMTFTTTISPELVPFLDDFSKKLNTSKNSLVETALKKYLFELKRDEYKKSFKKAKNDTEINELTESGFEDFLEIIEK